MGECRTTANLQRAPGHCWLQDFHYQTNEHLFQCRLAVELLLLLKPLPKYHSFHKTCAAAAASEELRVFQPLCPRFGHPQTECSIFRDSSALEKSLFSSIHEPSEVAHSITHWDHGSGGSCHSLELDSGSLMSPREGAAAAMEQQLVWGRAECPTEGAVRKGSHPVHALKRRKEEPLLPFIFLLFHHLHFPLGNILVNNWIPEIEE